jgi:hypothetical protein
MTKQNILSWTRALSLPLILAGCGGKGGPVPVQGIVTLDGQPVANAQVTFAPEAMDGHMAFALTDDDGVFSLTTPPELKGALPGAYKVLITKAEPVTLPTLKPGTDMRQVRYELKKQAKRNPPKSLVPKVYGNAQQTPLRWQVPSDGKRTLELTSK